MRECAWSAAQDEQPVAALVALTQHLEGARFRDFWLAQGACHDVVAGVAGFYEAVRRTVARKAVPCSAEQARTWVRLVCEAHRMSRSMAVPWLRASRARAVMTMLCTRGCAAEPSAL